MTIAVLIIAGIGFAAAVALAVADRLDDDGAVHGRVLGELAQRGFAGLADYVDADLGIAGSRSGEQILVFKAGKVLGAFPCGEGFSVFEKELLGSCE